MGLLITSEIKLFHDMVTLTDMYCFIRSLDQNKISDGKFTLNFSVTIVKKYTEPEKDDILISSERMQTISDTPITDTWTVAYAHAKTRLEGRGMTLQDQI